MAGQGEVLITRSVPGSTARGLFISGAGTLSAVLPAIGCLVEGTDAGELKASVQVGGIALGQYGEAIAVGEPLQSAADGQLISAVAASGLECAIALEAGVAGELRSVKLL